MKRKTIILLSTLFLFFLFSLQRIPADAYTLESGTYYQVSQIQIFSGNYNETNQYGEDKGNYLTISNGLNSITTFAWYKTNYYYDDFPHQVMSGTITKNADGSYSVINDTDAIGNDPVESCIESITPISDSEIIVYSWGEGDGRWDDYYTMRRVGTSKSQSNSVNNDSILGEYVSVDSTYSRLDICSSSNGSLQAVTYLTSGGYEHSILPQQIIAIDASRYSLSDTGEILTIHENGLVDIGGSYYQKCN